MTDLAVIATDARTGVILDELPVDSFDWAPSLNQGAQLSASMTATNEKAQVIAEGATVVHLTDGANIVGGNAFLVNQVKWADRKLTVTGDSLRNWLDRRNLRAAKTYTSQDQFSIVADLLAYANASSLGIGVTFRGSPASSGVNRARVYPADRTSIGQLIDGLATLDQGFDWDVTAEWSASNLITRHLECWYPTRGTATALVWEHGKNCRVSEYSSDASKLASLVEIAGNTSTSTQTYGAASESPVGYPRFDLLDSVKTSDETNAGNASSLNAKASASLARNHAPLETCTIVDLAFGPLDDTNVKAWTLGDQITLAADLGFRQLASVWRIVACSYKLAQGRLICDQATLARPLPGDPIRRPDGFREIARAIRRVGALERR